MMPNEENGVIQEMRTLVSNVQKRIGDAESIRLMGEQSLVPVESIPTGCPTLDYALGVGGYPRGRMIELYGEPSSGKSTLALHSLGFAQKLGHTVAFIDAEQAMAGEYAKSIGIDTDVLIFGQPSSAEEVLEIVEALIAEKVDLIVVDTVAAMVPKAVLKAEVGDRHVAVLARLMSQNLPRIAANIRESKSIVIFINQTRSTIVQFGPSTTTPGGNALKFYSSVRIELRRSQLLKAGDQKVGNRVVATMVKNKVGPPYQEAVFDIIWGYGVDDVASTLDAAIGVGIATQRGSSYELGDGEKYRGRANALAALRTNADMLERVRMELFELWKLAPYLSLVKHALASSVATQDSSAGIVFNESTWESVAAMTQAVAEDAQLLQQLHTAVGVPYTEAGSG